MVRTSPGRGPVVAASYLQGGVKLQDQQTLYHTPDESRARALSCSIYEVKILNPIFHLPFEFELSNVRELQACNSLLRTYNASNTWEVNNACAPKRLQTAQHDANDEKIAHLQRVLGELRGSLEGVKIRIEVEGEGWRGRVDRLEKELDSMKEADEDIIAAKHNFKNEFKVKWSKFMVDTQKLLLQEREEVAMKST